MDGKLGKFSTNNQYISGEVYEYPTKHHLPIPFYSYQESGAEGDISIFTESFKSPHVYMGQFKNAIVSPRPVGQPRYWVVAAGENYLWNIINDAARQAFAEQGIVERDGDRLKLFDPSNTDFPQIHLKSGPILFLFCFHNADHFYRETVPALMALMSSGHKMESLKIISNTIPPGHFEILQSFGILRHNVIQCEMPWIIAPELIVPSFLTIANLHTPSRYYWESARHISKYFRDGKTLGAKKIFVSRRNARQRRLLNTLQIEADFEAKGFQVIEPGDHTLKEQVRLFSDAEVVVGPHGMGIANAVFSEKLKVLVEIFSTSWNRVSYFRTAQFAGSSYGAYYAKTYPNGDVFCDRNSLFSFVCKIEEKSRLR